MSTKGERYIAAVEAREKEYKNDVPGQPKSEPTYGNDFKVEEEPAASVAAARTLEDSEREYREKMTGPDAPEWARPARNDLAQPAIIEGEVGDVAPALVATPEAYAASVKELNDAHTKAVTDLGEAHRRRLSQLLTARRNVEVEEAKSSEKGLAGNLKAVLKSMAEAEEERGSTAAEAAALADAQSDAAVLAGLRARVKPALDAADAVAASLHLWASQFKAPFDKLKETDRATWLENMPSTTSEEVQSSAAMGYQINRLLNDVLSLYENALATQRDNRRGIESLITTGRFRLDKWEFDRSLNQFLHELRMADVADSLNNYTRGIVDLAARIQAKKDSTKGTTQPAIIFENKENLVYGALDAEAKKDDGRTRVVTEDGWGKVNA